MDYIVDGEANEMSLATENAALRRENSELNRLIDRANESCAALRGEVARLREAVEWAIAHLDGFKGLQDWENFRPLSFKAELKRRAVEG